MQFADINGITLHYQVIGAPAGKPVLVFANSLGTDFRIWRDVIVKLVGECAIVTYDKRGHGLSDTGKAPYSMDDHVDDLAGLLDMLKVRGAIICGLSVGGMIAQGLYHKRRDLVSALILCDTADKVGTTDSWNARIAAVEADGIASLSGTILKMWFTEDFHTSRTAELAGYRNMLERTTVAGYTGTCAVLRDTDFTAKSPGIAVPTLCIVGDKDGSTPPELVLAMAKRIPAARYEVIKDAGHIPCVEQPDVLVTIIKSFVDLLSAEGQGNA